MVAFPARSDPTPGGNRRFTLSSPAHPCPVCGRTKDGDCRSSQDGHFVLCHSDIHGRQRGENRNGFTYLQPSRDQNWGQWIAHSEDWSKLPRPVGQEFRYPYSDRQGDQRVAEVRIYQPGGGKKQWMEPKGVDTRQLVPYRYAEALAALAQGTEPCFIVEGPPKADALWELGLPAVAFASGFQEHRDSHWFEGYENCLVIVPDQDKPGVGKAERLQNAYPMARWLLPWPDSCWWEPEWLPEKGGRDIKDWVDQLRQQGQSDNQIRDRILGAVLPAGERGLQVEADSESAQELSELVELESLNRPHILPEALLSPLRQLAGRLNLPIKAYVSALVVAASTQLAVGTRLELDPGTGFSVPPILWVGVVGETGSKKSPLLRAIIFPLDSLQQQAEQDYQARLERYERELEHWEAQEKGRRGKKPVPPVPREYYLSDFTLEALAGVLGSQSDRGLLLSIDELARFFSSMDAYRNGKGGDRQHYLSFYDGGSFKANRNSTGRVYAAKTSISLLGGIQPGIVQKIMGGDTSQEDGLWSRFTWVRIPLTASPGIHEGTCDLSPLLESLYEGLGRLDAATYRLEGKAIALWNHWHAEVETLILKEASPILRATYPKARERAARIALVIHLIDAVIARREPEGKISAPTLQKAIQFTRWLMGQTRLLYAEFGIADNPETARILKFVNRFRGCGWVTTRMVRNWWPSREKPSFEVCRKFMFRVVSLGYARGNDREGKDYQIEISHPVVNVVTADPKTTIGKASGGDEKVVASIVTVVTPASGCDCSGDAGDEQKDEGVVTAASQVESGLPPVVTNMTTEPERDNGTLQSGERWVKWLKIDTLVRLRGCKGDRCTICPPGMSPRTVDRKELDFGSVA